MVDLSPGASVVLGVFVGLLSTSIQSIGLTLQRKSHLLEDEKEEDDLRRPPYKRRRWQLGMLMFIISNIVGSTIQITTLPLPVLSTLQASGLVFNSICATLILGEPFTRYSLVGTILVAIGAVFIGTFGAITEPSHNLDQLLELLGRRQFVIWFVGTFVLVGGVLLGSWLLKRLTPRPTARMRLFWGMCFGFISGILSAHSLLVAKSAVELLVRTIIDRHNQFDRWQSWVTLLGLVSLALTQLYFLHRGLKLCSTSVLYPFVFCIYNIIAILDGLIYFRQASRLPVLHGALIALGTAILLSGVAALSWRLDHEVTASKLNLKARVATPLGPGMGLVDPASGDEDNLLPFAAGETAEHEVVDEELGLKDDRPSRKGRPSPPGADERTPLLGRTSTAPTILFPSSKKRSLRRPAKSRRMTMTEETSEIWDELNDRDDYRRTSHSATLASPTSLRGKRSRTQSGNVFSKNRRKSSGTPSRPISEGLRPPSRKQNQRDASVSSRGGEETDEGSPMLGARRRRSEGRGWISSHSREEGIGEWLRLKWWKRRRRDGFNDIRNEVGESPV